MQWKNHRITTCAVTYALTGSFPATAIATASSMLPDVLEMKLLKHRTMTHYPWVFLIPIVLMWSAMQHSPGYTLYTAFFIFFGYLCHLAEDFMSKSGIPLVSPFGEPTGLGLYVTHAPSEFRVALIIVALAVAYSWHNGLLTQDYLMHAANNMAILVMGVGKTITHR